MQENKFKHAVVCKIAAILARPMCLLLPQVYRSDEFS